MKAKEFIDLIENIESSKSIKFKNGINITRILDLLFLQLGPLTVMFLKVSPAGDDEEAELVNLYYAGGLSGSIDIQNLEVSNE